MRSLLLALVALFALSAHCVASPLAKMAEAIEALGRYDAQFEILIGGVDESVRGSYRVDGERYELEVAGEHIFGDGAERCSVNHAQREVVLERLASDGSVPMLIINPAQAFAQMEGEFNVDQVTETESCVRLYLTPKDSAQPLNSALVELDPVSYLPRVITYVAQGEMIMIDLLSISYSDTPITPSYPDDYFVVDLRE